MKKITNKELKKIWKLIFDEKKLGIKIRWIPAKRGGIPRQYFVAPLADCAIQRIFLKKEIKQKNHFNFWISEIIQQLQRKIRHDIEKNKWCTEIVVFVSEKLVMTNASKCLAAMIGTDDIILFGIAKYWGR